MYFPTIYSRTGSFLILGMLGGIFHCFFFLQIFLEHTQVNSEDADHTPHYAALDLVSTVCLFPTKRTAKSWFTGPMQIREKMSLKL